MKLGSTIPQLSRYDLATDTVEAAKGLEEIGFDSLWAYERLLAPVDQSGEHGMWSMPDVPWPPHYTMTGDPLIALALAAAVTSRVELGTGVMVPPLHVPVTLAKTLATLDAASGGRLILGAGTGWSIDEFAAVAPRPIAERGAALDEFLDAAAALWSPDPVEFTSERWAVPPSYVNPKPARPIPIYLAATTKTAFRRIARRADGWLPNRLPAAEVVSGLARLRDMAAEAGRSPSDIDVIFMIGVQSLAEVPARDRPPYAGSPAQIAEDVAALAEAGVSHVYVNLATVARDVKELLGLAAEFHGAVRALGV